MERDREMERVRVTLSKSPFKGEKMVEHTH